MQSIGPQDVHAWLVDLDGPPAADLATLDRAERDRAASYLRPEHRSRFAASHAALRLILSRYLDCSPAGLRFLAGRHGRPWLASHDLRFSLSRSGGAALIAVSPGPVGADLAAIAPLPGLADLATARFAASETACLASGCGGSPVRGFYRHWIAKEAYLKALGVGLAGLADAELVCDPVPTIWFRGRASPSWSLSVTEVAPGYLAAVAAPGRVTSWRLLAA